MSKRAYLQQIWRTLNYLPPPVTVPFLVGCAALLLFFALPPTTYNNLAPLFASQPSDDSSKSRNIAVRALGMEKNGHASERVDERRTSLVRERVAMNILLRSGYLSTASAREQGSPPTVSYGGTLDDSVWQCVDLDPEEQWHLPSDLRQNAQQMAVAAVAIEKFHRNPAQRWLEWTYLKAFSAIFRRPPNLSVGPAQVRISQIKQIAADTMAKDGPYSALRQPDAELMKAAADECKSLRLAATLIYYYLEKFRNSPACDSEDPFCVPALAVAAYAGKRWKTNAIIDYAPVVAAMVEIIYGSDISESDADNAPDEVGQSASSSSPEAQQAVGSPNTGEENQPTQSGSATMALPEQQPTYTKEQIQKIKNQRGNALSQNALIEQVNVAMTNKNWQAAIATLQQLIAANPYNWQYYSELGDAQLNLQQYEQAVEAYQKGIQVSDRITTVDPKNPITDPAKRKAGLGKMLTNEGNALLKLHKNDEAIQAFARAVSVDPDPGIAYFNLCAAQYNTGNLGDALDVCEKAIAADPNRADAYFIKGSLLMASSKPDSNGKIMPPRGTAEALNKYLELAPRGAHANDVLQMLSFIGAKVDSPYKKKGK